MKTFKIAKLIALGLLVTGFAILATGCASFVQNAKKTEYATASMADGAMKSWAVYYHSATNHPSDYGLTLAQVEQEHSDVNALAKKIGASLTTVDSFVDAYATNSATKSALQSAINAAADNASQLVTLIAQLTGKTTFPTP